MLRQEFTYINSGESFTPALQQMLDFAHASLSPSAQSHDLTFRLKMVITELLANAAKHSQNTITHFNIAVAPADVLIEKTDHGRPLKVINGIEPPARLNITSDVLHNLCASYHEKYKLTFACEEKEPLATIDVNEVPEHFGLLIITKAADEFTYTFEPQTNRNIFTARLKLI